MPTGAFGAGLSGGLAHGLMQGYQLQQYRDQLEQHKEELGLRKKLVESQAGLYDIETQKHNMAVQSALKQALMNESLGAQFEQMGQGQVAPRSQMDMGQDIMTLGRQYAAEAQPGELPQSVNPADIATTQTTPPAMEQNQANLRAMLARGGHIKEATEGIPYFEKPVKPNYTMVQPVPGEPLRRIEHTTGNLSPVLDEQGKPVIQPRLTADMGNMREAFATEYAKANNLPPSTRFADLPADIQAAKNREFNIDIPKQIAGVKAQAEQDVRLSQAAPGEELSKYYKTSDLAKGRLTTASPGTSLKELRSSDQFTFLSPNDQQELQQVNNARNTIRSIHARAKLLLEPTNQTRAALAQPAELLALAYGLHPRSSEPITDIDGTPTTRGALAKAFRDQMLSFGGVVARGALAERGVLTDKDRSVAVSAGDMASDTIVSANSKNKLFEKLMDWQFRAIARLADNPNDKLKDLISEKDGIIHDLEKTTKRQTTTGTKIHPSMPDGLTPKQQELWMQTYMKRDKP